MHAGGVAKQITNLLNVSLTGKSVSSAIKQVIWQKCVIQELEPLSMCQETNRVVTMKKSHTNKQYIELLNVVINKRSMKSEGDSE